jgi:hypothetical protein
MAVFIEMSSPNQPHRYFLGKPQWKSKRLIGDALGESLVDGVHGSGQDPIIFEGKGHFPSFDFRNHLDTYYGTFYRKVKNLLTSEIKNMTSTCN